MSKDMKLIMERWDRFVIEEQFEDCDTPFLIGDFVVAASLAETLDNAEETRKKQEAIANSPLRQFTDRATKLSGPLARLGIAAAGAGFLGAGAAGVVAGAGTAGAAYTIYKTTKGYKALADDGAEVLGNLFLVGSQKEDVPAYHEFLETFCVDQETLSLIEDRYQNEYINESGVIDQLKAYIGNPANANKPIPDITEHLVDWINTKSDYKNSDDTALVAKQ